MAAPLESGMGRAGGGRGARASVPLALVGLAAPAARRARAAVIALARAAVIAPAASIALAGCASPRGDTADAGACAAADAARPAPPPPYAGLRDPDPAPDDAAFGRDVYARACASCHGAADATDLPRGLTRDYVFWRVAEGGRPPFCSPMPAFRETTSSRDRWRVTAYVVER